MYAFDAPLVARFFAIEELRAAGWTHRVDATVVAVASPSHQRIQSERGKRDDDAERMWSGQTYCPECAARARARAAVRASSVPSRAGTSAAVRAAAAGMGAAGAIGEPGETRETAKARAGAIGGSRQASRRERRVGVRRSA
jgi:hypothetical protein